MEDLARALREEGLARAVLLSDPPSGLLAVIAIDDLTLGPAAGGVRTRRYPGLEAALREAAGLARAMTVKCALAGLDAGGAKAVVIDGPALDRPRAFEALGRRVEELGGIFRTAGDLGTTSEDLAAMARRTRFVHAGDVDLADAVARGLVRCVEACCARRGARIAGLRVAIQGAGAIGRAAARALARAGAQVLVADIDAARALAVATETGARVVEPEDLLLCDADVLAPCATGGVIDAHVARRMRAWALCPAANNAVVPGEAGAILVGRGVVHVPDAVASAGAVIQGIAPSVMGVADPTPLIDALGATATRVLEESARLGEPADQVAIMMARARIEARRDQAAPESRG